MEFFYGSIGVVGNIIAGQGNTEHIVALYGAIGVILLGVFSAETLKMQ